MEYPTQDSAARQARQGAGEAAAERRLGPGPLPFLGRNSMNALKIVMKIIPKSSRNPILKRRYVPTTDPMPERSEGIG